MLVILWLVGLASGLEFVVLCCADNQTHNLVHTLLLISSAVDAIGSWGLVKEVDP